jgi:addiction module RelE/StbE family toxin
MSQIRVAFSSSFKRALKSLLKKHPAKQKNFEERLTLFIENPYHPKLETHKLKGHLNGYLAFTIEYDIRVIFYFESDHLVIFTDIGTHDEVY